MRTRRAPASKPATSSDKGVNAIECELLVSGRSCSCTLFVGGVGAEMLLKRAQHRCAKSRMHEFGFKDNALLIKLKTSSWSKPEENEEKVKMNSYSVE